MDSKQPISIMIHDLNPWGGQDRSMLEIAWQLNKKFPLEIHSYSLVGYDSWPDMTHVKYESKIKRPVIFKYLNYHLKSWQQLKNSPPQNIIQSTGTASLKSDVVQVQFVHHEWLKIAESLPKDKGKNQILKAGYHHWLNRYKLFLEKKIYTPEKKYIAISHIIKKELMEHFNIPEENITIIHHGVDLNYFKPLTDESLRKNIRSQYGISDTDFVLLHVGALNARKGIFKSLEILKHLKDNNFHNVKLLAVGQGDLSLLNKKIDELGIKDRVIFEPHSKDIRNFYWAADTFFFPTFYEPFGLVTIEAMACGLPVAVGQTSGAAELIEDGLHGILFSPNDSVENIAQALNPLLKDSQYRKVLSENALSVAQNQSWSKVGKQYQEFYSQLLQSHKK